MTDRADGTQAETVRGRNDVVSLLYVIGGIPAIVGFLVILFAIGVRMCGLPA
jgi:hypothetical protein